MASTGTPPVRRPKRVNFDEPTTPERPEPQQIPPESITAPHVKNVSCHNYHNTYHNLFGRKIRLNIVTPYQLLRILRSEYILNIMFETSRDFQRKVYTFKL